MDGNSDFSDPSLHEGSLKDRPSALGAGSADADREDAADRYPAVVARAWTTNLFPITLNATSIQSSRE